jgi:hypothetical protein
MTSRFAKAFLFIALLYALLTAGELWTSLQFLNVSFQATQDKIFQTMALVGRWAIDPAFMCGTAVMVEFLERIWRELAKRSDTTAQAPAT